MGRLPEARGRALDHPDVPKPVVAAVAGRISESALA
jgi:hypothetical protein